VRRMRIEELEGRAAVVTVDPAEHVPHRVLSQRGGVNQGREQSAGALGPMMFPAPQAVEPRGTDHGVSGHDSRIPGFRGGQR
jgi:hypothetical protein